MALKIMVIDDDPDIVDVLTVLLEGEGYEVASAKDGAEGLEKIKEENPDVIILDLMMPNVDGFTVCRTLKDPRWSRWGKIPIMVLTSIREEASGRRYELETGMRMDVDDYVEKPINPDVILERMEKIVARLNKE